MTNLAVPRGILSVQYGSLRARALAAIGRGDFEQAYRFAAAISRPGCFASHVGEALFVCMDLVEAAIRTNRVDEANAHVEAMREEGIAALSPRLALLVAGSAAIACPDNVATDLFEQALAVPGTEHWPFDRARVQLAYGEHLRRTRSTSSSRSHLSAAVNVFERLGAHPWARRAGNELRATGRMKLDDHFPDPGLTPQEREIAILAASGMSNKQIAERLYLSHRTVANHLYRAFPKLGITSRAGLRDSLVSDEISRDIS
jgi:DNA-binding CsgD family transcriptional regulator